MWGPFMLFLFGLELVLETVDGRVSPVIDTQRMNAVLVSNRVDKPISNFLTDNRVNTLKDDPNAFVYAIKPIALKSGATGIKIHMEGHINVTSDISFWIKYAKCF